VSQEMIRKDASLSERMWAGLQSLGWHGPALAAILGLSAFLNLYGLAGEGYANTYYSAAVKNMLTSPYNFFFVSFDAGFVSVDKPPLGLWIQAASAWLFGSSGLSVLLPQAIAGVLCVALIYYLVRRTFGPVAGLLAALVLSLTPIIVVTSRNNTHDMLLVLTLLLATWAFMVAAEKGRLDWLLLGAFLVGLGFNIKMMQAFMVLPALYLFYLVATRLSTWRRLAHLGLATLVLFAVSLSWAVVVDLTPPEERPYVGSSFTDSVLELAVGYNGAVRVLGIEGISSLMGGSDDGKAGGPPAAPSGPPGGGPGGASENGQAGPLRLLNVQLAAQAGWLLPLAVMGLVAAVWHKRPRLPLDVRQQSLVLWGTWLFTMVAFFSVAGFFHRYYLVMLAPAVAALVGAGVTALWSDYRRPGWRGWLLPLALVGAAGAQAYILSDYSGWSGLLTPTISGLCLVAAVVPLVSRLRPGLGAGVVPAGAVAVGILSLLIAPTAWASYNVFGGESASPMAAALPVAGPQPDEGEFAGMPGAGPGGPPGTMDADPALVGYLRENGGDATYLLAAANALVASPIILAVEEPVISLGGFMGFDPVFNADELAGLVDTGAVRFFLVLDEERLFEAFSKMMTGTSPDGSTADTNTAPSPPPFANESTDWVEDNCQQVPRELWQSSDLQGSGDMRGIFGEVQALYDCGGGG
jgi:4-amino-4-deoxy-L-arabinose transferase-like glycosyltransferase